MTEDLEIILEQNKKTNDKNLISYLIQYSKKKYENPIDFFDQFILTIKNNPSIKEEFISSFKLIFNSISMQKFLTDYGIFYENNFFKELFRQITNQFLPEISNDKTLLSLINDVLYLKNNHKYIKSIPLDRWIQFYTLIFEEDCFCNEEFIKSQIREASIILCNRIMGSATERELYKLSYIKSIEANPFFLMNKLLMPVLENHEILNHESFSQIEKSISDCYLFLDNIINQKDNKGISLTITISVTRLRQQLNRLLVLIKQLYYFDNEGIAIAMAQMTKNWLNFYSPKNKIVNSFSSTLYVLTFLITWHNGKTGVNYITNTARQYAKMFYSAAGGGAIVALLCFFKAQISLRKSPAFEEAFLYSINYAIGFVAIYLLHFTLATKQPAMTAASLAKELEKDTKTADNYQDFAILFSRLFRSQFIAFMGNVLAVFPIAILIFYILTNLLHIPREGILPENKAQLFYDEVVNFHPVIIWYGAIAGVFLFLSGMISGLTENNNRYRNIPERIYHQPLFKKLCGEKTRRKFIKWYSKKIGGIAGNVSLGFFLGCSYLIEKFFGFPFDIRHITFAAGSFGMAISYKNFIDVGVIDIFKGFGGIFSIGIANFLVSFLPSLYIAMKSTNIPGSEIKYINKAIFKLFIKNPFRFFFPIK